MNNSCSSFEIESIPSIEQDQKFDQHLAHLAKTIKEDFFDKETLEQVFDKLPIIRSTIQEEDGNIRISLLAQSKYTSGLGRFVANLCNRFLVPGQPLVIFHSTSLRFRIKNTSQPVLFYRELYLENLKNVPRSLLEKNLIHFKRVLTYAILSVQHARKIIEEKPLSSTEKEVLIDDELHSLFSYSNQERSEILSRAPAKFLEIADREKLSDYLLPLLKPNQSVFHRDIYNEMQHFLSLIPVEFFQKRHSSHLVKIFSYQFLFRKVLTRATQKEPCKKHLSVKIFTNPIIGNEWKNKRLGILISLNIDQENEFFMDSHLLSSCLESLPHLVKDDSSSILDIRVGSSVRTIYLEIFKQPSLEFTLREIKKLKRDLARSILKNIESKQALSSIKRDEVEIMRGIIELSKGIQNAQSIPQMRLDFKHLSQKHLVFSVTILRVLKKNSTPYRKHFEAVGSHLFHNFETRLVGLIENRFLKEVTSFDLHLPSANYKDPLQRLEILRAREHALKLLRKVIGEFVDCNPNQIPKQSQVIKILKNSLHQYGVSQDDLIESFFYSIQPSYMQTQLPLQLIKHIIIQLGNLTEQNSGSQLAHIHFDVKENHFCMICVSRLSEMIETLIQNLESFKRSIIGTSIASASYKHSFYLSMIIPFDSKEEFLHIKAACSKIYSETLNQVQREQLQPL